ncbi:virion protein [uncultured Caudovirales phage]|uniref:Virion protein n=1 Tax=uncultured Caudovirales phage TaxID=2100421 RepID=A0A6J5KXC2_9CAUD|nr:virion protein [uncultured Caudovirales phage]
MSEILPGQREGGPRSWRNLNPGNIRPIKPPDHWQGQSNIDTNPGGPFVIFAREEDGWRAVCKVLLRYQQGYNLRSVRDMLYRYAPPMENPTDAYVTRVCATLGVQPTDPVDVRRWPVMRQMLLAIAAVEGGPKCPAWPEAGMIKGMRAAGLEPG